MELPQEIEKREKLAEYIRYGVEETLIVSAAKGHLSDMKKGVKEQFSISAKEFDDLIAASLDEEYAQKRFEEAEDFMHIVEILRNAGALGE